MKTNNINSITLQQYLRGELDRKERYDLEKQTLEDPFLNDALEGYELTPAADANLSLLQRQLQDRIAVQHANKKQHGITSLRLSIAAVAAVTFITASILFWLNQRPQQGIANASEKTVEANLQPDLVAKAAPTAQDTQARIGAILDSASTPVLIAADNDAALKAAEAKRQLEAKNAAARAALAQQSKVNGNTVALAETAVPQTRETEPEVKPAAQPAAAVVSRSAEPEPETTSTGTGRTAKPNIGMPAYRQYIANNVRYPAGSTVSGRVVVSATIKPDGRITNVRIVRGLDDATNAEAIRLVTSGPTWAGAAKDDEVRINVDFKKPKD